MANKFVQLDMGTPIDFSKLTFTVPRKNPSGGSSVSLLYEGKTPILELPAFYIFPPSIPEGATIPKLTAKLPSEKYKTEQTDEFRRNIDKLTSVLIEEAIKQGRGGWVPSRVQKLTPESVSAVMNPLIKVPEDPNKSPLFNCKFDGWESVTTEIFDSKMNQVPIDSAPIESILPMGSIVKMKVVPKIWTSPNGFGATFTIKKIKKEPVSGGIPRGCWNIEGDEKPVEEAEPIGGIKRESTDVPESVEQNTLLVADSDEEASGELESDVPISTETSDVSAPLKKQKKVSKLGKKE